MAEDTNEVPIRILDKQYLVACKPGERDELYASARLLDKTMRDIRDSGKVIGTERIAVMAALNIAHDLLREQEASSGYTDALNRRIRILQDRIASVLESERQNDLIDKL